MMFLPSMTVPRAGRKSIDFCHEWTDREASVSLSKVGHTMVEFLTSSSDPGKLFLDRDVYLGVDPPSSETVTAETLLVEAKVTLMMQRLTIDQTDLTCVIATRHGFCSRASRYKLSFRPFIQGMRLRYTDIPEVITWVGQDDFWDMSVYKAREQLLASVNGCKGRTGSTFDSRILAPERTGDDLLKYVVQHVDVTWPFLDIPVTQLSSRLDAYRIKSPALTRKDRRFIRSLMSCLSSTSADDRRLWITIGIVLKVVGGDVFYTEWLAFSKKGAKFVNDDDCWTTWMSLGCSATCGLGTLCHHAMRDDPLSYHAAKMVRHGSVSRSVDPLGDSALVRINRALRISSHT